MVTVASQKKLFTFFQRDGMDNSSYHREFIAHIETIETYGGTGAIGITPTFVAQKLQEMHAVQLCTNPAKPTDSELALANKTVRDEFLAALMLSGANRDRSGALRNELANQFGFGNDLYPKTPDQCLTMMNCRMDSAPRLPRGNPRQPPVEQPAKPEEDALVFTQGADKKPSGSRCSLTLSPRAPHHLVPSRGGKRILRLSAGLAANKDMFRLSAPRRPLLNTFMPWPRSLTTLLRPVRKIVSSSWLRWTNQSRFVLLSVSPAPMLMLSAEIVQLPPLAILLPKKLFWLKMRPQHIAVSLARIFSSLTAS